MTKVSTVEARVEKDQIVETEWGILRQMEEDTEEWAKEENCMTEVEAEKVCLRITSKKC